MTVNLTDPIFTDEDKARAYFEEIRWPNGVTCPHCGNANSARIYSIAANAAKKIRAGLRECQDCHGQFTVRTGGVMESSHVPLTKWALAYRLLASSKKGMSAHQLHRMLAVTYKTAWFMAHRIREAMRPTDDGQLGGEGKTVEADETYVGGKAKNRAYTKTLSRHEAVTSLVERGGKVRSHHVADVTAKTLKPILVDAIAKDTNLRTDQSPVYTEIGTGFASHATVNHSIKEYVRGDAHTNTVEGYFSIFKRGIYGVYHHVSAEHLKRYLCEFDFRYNERIALGVTDTERTEKAIRGAVGKRLTYRQPRGAEQAQT
jgi:transposase-like protein